MPMLDMPLEQLYRYGGTNPCPEDHAAYWQAALNEMRTVNPQLAFRLASFRCAGVVCQDMFFTGVGGARIHIKYACPERAAGPLPAVLQFHGYSNDAGDWWEKLSFTQAGFAVFAMDVRGQGGQSQDSVPVRGNTLHGHIIRGLDDAPEKLFYRSVFLDTAQLASIVLAMEDVDESRVMAMGGSQGGALAIACAALEPRVARLAALHPFLADYQRVWQMDMVQRAYAELQEYFRRFDPLHRREDEVFTRLGYIDIQHLAHRIRAKTLMGFTLQDATCPPSSQFAVYNKIAAEKQALVYPDFAHERPPGYLDEVFAFFCE